MDGLIFAVQFLTRIPINIQVDANSRTIARSTMFFPFTGMIIGAAAGGAYLIGLLMGRDMAALFGVAALVFMTGGLHIDGLSDTCDGFFSARKKERILEIMKDSHSGTFGVIAVVMDLLAKYVLLARLQASPFTVLMLTCANARLASVMLMSFTRTARPGGMGAMFSDSHTKRYFFIGAGIYAAFTAFFFSPVSLLTLAASIAAAALIAVKSYRTIGGLTGDVYGANAEICEIVSIAVFEAVAAWM